MDANTFLQRPLETQFNLLAEARHDGWMFETEVGALDADQMEDVLRAELARKARKCTGCTFYGGNDCSVATTGLTGQGLPWDGQCSYLPTTA